VIVIDASVLTQWLIGQPAAVGALESELAGRNHQPIVAPQLIDLETLNALRGLVRGGEISDARADAAARDLADVPIRRYPHGPLRERAWELRHTLTPYDASYLALAEAFAEPVLITSDSGLASVAEKSLGPAQVRLVG
jgi:predicted nucleic acid-binding protein